jgi:hypothetical protein
LHLDAGKAARYNASGEFWATTEIGIAEWFAKSNPAGNPAIYAFELSEAVIQALVNSAAKAVFAHAAGVGIDYEFLPASFARGAEVGWEEMFERLTGVVAVSATPHWGGFSWPS